MPKYPDVYPSKVEYRPGRIQSLNPEQEITLKQCWAVLLKYWGYEVEISTSDIHSPNAFVASTVTHQLKTSRTNSELGVALKKKKSFFHRKKPSAPAAVSSRREHQIRNGDLERYEPVEQVSESIRYIFKDHYKEGNQENLDNEEGWNNETEDYGSEGNKAQDVGNMDDDAESIETFYSALSNVEGVVDLEDVVNNVKSTRGEASNAVEGETLEVKSTQSKSKSTLDIYINEISKVATRESHVKCHRDIYLFMRQYDPKVLHNSLMRFPRHDLMDNLLLRYVRARKYVVEDAIKMFANSLEWKVNGYKVNDLLEEGDAPSFFNGTHKGFVKNFTVGKSMIRGHDRNKNPLFIFQSRKHFASDSPLPETERFALVVIEWCRLFLREVHESVDTCSIMFDLSGFSMKNADNAPVKFLTSMFEAHYPECLGIVIIHNAPWVFSTVWSIIKNWLDPVVTSKIHFTKSYEDLVEFIEPEHIPAYLGGKDNHDNSYDKPEKKHTVPPKAKDDTYKNLRKLRDELHMKFMETTKRWVESTNSDVSAQYLRDKIYLSYELSDNYIELDPYIRNPGIYDRNGTLVLRN